MIEQIKSFDKYNSFIESFYDDINYLDPHLLMKKEKNEDINDWPKRSDNICFSVQIDGETKGLFVFSIIPEEKYMEMLMGLSRNPETVEEMLCYLVNNYKGFHIDFVFNPKWEIFKNGLKKHGAIFDIEQERMTYSHKQLDINTEGIVAFSEEYRERYIKMHTVDRYWTAEKTIEAKNKFNIFLALENNKVVGYIDVSNCYKENEPYDLFVLPEYRGKGYGKKLLVKALKDNEPNDMMLLVDIDNSIGINLYKSVGFIKKERFNMLTASIELKY